jgi:hypothetical protein
VSGYNAKTTFIVPSSGYYLLTYKVDMMAGGSGTGKGNYSTILTNKGVAIEGSCTLVESPDSNHMYTISNTVLSSLTANDTISLLVWARNGNGAQIGSPTDQSGLLPSGVTPKQATATIVFTRLSNN